MADLLVAPVTDIERAVGPHLLGHGNEIHVVAAHEVAAVLARVCGAVGIEVIGHQTVAVEVAEDELVAIGRGELAALVDREAAVGVATAFGIGIVIDDARAGRRVMGDIGAGIAGVVRVVGNGLDVLIRVRIEVLTTLALVARAWDDVIQMWDHAGGDEELAVLVVVQSPGIAGTMGEDFELMAHGMVAPDAAVERRAFAVGRAGLADVGIGEDALAAVEPAIGTPDEAVQGFVGVLRAPAIEEDFGRETQAGHRMRYGRGIGFVVAVLVGDEHEVGRSAHPDTAEADFNAADEAEAFGEDRALVEGAIALGVFKNEDAVLAGARCARLRVAHALHHPQASALVPAHGDGLHELGLSGDEFGFEASRELHGFDCLLRRLAVRVVLLRHQPRTIHFLRFHLRGGRGADFLALLQQQKNAGLVAHDHIHQPVAIHIAGLNIRAHTAVGINEMRNKIHLAAGQAFGFIPVDHAGAALIRIMAVVRPIALADDDVLHAIAVDVGKAGGVRLGKDDAVIVVVRLLAGQHALLPLRTLVAGVIEEDGDTVAMRLQAGEDIVAAIAIEVIGKHLRPTANARCEGVLFPQAAVGVLPPVACFQEVHLAVAVHIPHPETMGKLAHLLVVGNRHKFPLLGGLAPVRFEIAEFPARAAHDLWFAVAGDVGERG